MSPPDPSPSQASPPADAEILAAVEAVRAAEAVHAEEVARARAARAAEVPELVRSTEEEVPPEILALRSRAFNLLMSAHGERIRRGYLAALGNAGALGQDSVNRDCAALLLRCFDSLLKKKDPTGIQSLPDWISRVTWIGTQDLLRKGIRRDRREVSLERKSGPDGSCRPSQEERAPKCGVETALSGGTFPSPEDAIAHAQLLQGLELCLEVLPPELREVALDRALEVSVDALAVRHQCTKGTISKWHKKAVALLRLCLMKRTVL